MKMKIKSLTIILIVFFINSDERLVVTGADEPVYAHAGEDVTLNCSVDTQVNVKGLRVEWKKTDESDIMVLRYAGGKNRPESQDGRYSGRAEFFTEEIPKGNFSMKLRKVRLEDKGEFRCEVHSDTDPNSTTARIAAVGYSSWHWGILVLCIAVILVFILTAALLARNCIKERKCGYPPLPLWSLVILPSIMVSSAFILWGVTEGSTEETVICTVISLLSFLVLFIMDPSCFFSGLSIRCKSLIRSTGITIIILIICSIPVTEFLITYSTTAPGKVALGVFVGGLVVTLFFVVSLQISFFWIWERIYDYFWKTLQKRLRRAICAITILLLIMVSVTIGVGVFVGTRFSDRPDIAAFIIVQLIMLLIPYVGLEIFLIFFAADLTRQHKLLYKFHDLFSSLIWWYNIVAFTFYVNFVAWVEDNFFQEYFICITVISLGISLCFIATIFLYSSKCFYVTRKILVGVLFLLHLILNIWYLSVILENDKGRTVKICELVFIYFLTAANNIDWYWNSRLVKLRIYIYISGVYAVPLLNSVALALALKLKADTGKQPFDLRLIVLISGSVFLFIWIAVQMSAYWLDTITKNDKDREPDQLRTQDTSAPLPKMTEEQLKLLNEVCDRHDQTKKKILNHIFHRKAGMSCQEVECPLSDESDWENQSYDGAATIRKAFFSWPRPQDSNQPKMTEEQLKFLNEVCDRQDQTMDKIVKHMLHRKAGMSCQEVKCPLPAMCSGATANDKDREPDQLRTLDTSAPLPKMTEEQLKFLNEVCDRQDQTMWMIVVHMYHRKASKFCQEAEYSLSDEKNQSYDGPTAVTT